MKSAFLFPGQASQKVGMGNDFYTKTDTGKQYFEIANEIMKVNLRDIILNGPEEVLKQTKYTQPAIFLVSVIIGELLKDNGIFPSAVAGHSLGEYSALTFAEAFTFETGLKLVKLRAESMQDAGTETDGSMAAIIGLDKETIEDICKQIEPAIVVPANFNAPGQIVISGEINALRTAMQHAKEKGAKIAVELNVSGAFHSPLMTSAKQALTDKLNSTVIENAQIPVYTNVTAKPISDAQEIRNTLIRQLDSPVYWQDSIINLRNDGITRMTEIGPGKVLQGLTKRIDRKIISSGIESLNDVNSYINE